MNYEFIFQKEYYNDINSDIKDLCFVVPIMSRKNGLQYFETSISKNKSIFKNTTLCLYINDSDLKKVKDKINIPYTVIPRVEHKAIIENFEKGSYNYWRSNLCADFIYSMEQSIKLHSECLYFAWLEDDVLLHPHLSSIWKQKENFVWTHNGHGATCIIFEKQYLIDRILPVTKSLYLNDMPLDWMFHHWSNPHQETSIPKIAFHIGVESSYGTTRPQDDWSEYNSIQ